MYLSVDVYATTSSAFSVLNEIFTSFSKSESFTCILYLVSETIITGAATLISFSNIAITTIPDDNSLPVNLNALPTDFHFE